MKECSVSGCGDTLYARGLCLKHYTRWRRHDNPLTILQAEEGAPQKFIEMAINHQDKEGCLFWPFAKSGGYAIYSRPKKYVCRIICEKVHGPPPSTKHQSAHSCGKGNLGCVNPHHLEWKTPKGNQADRIVHGTDNRGERSGNAKLTLEQVKEICSMQGKLSSREIGSKFGVSKTVILKIWRGEMWQRT